MKRNIFFLILLIVQISNAAEMHNEPKGLANLGNTCYLNSVVQCLLPIKSFRDAVLSYNPHQGDNEKGKKLTLSLQKLINEMQSPSKESIRPEIFVDLSNQCTFGLEQRGRQQDAEEFFSLLIDHLYPKKIKDLFTIKYTYKKIYNGIEVESVERKLPYLNISYDYLPTEKRATGMPIETLLKSFFSVPKKAIVEGADQAGIQGVYPMSETNDFIEASDILVVTAPRVNEMLEKHMIPFWTSNHQFYLSKKNDSSTKYRYSLIGAVLHSGMSLKSGHYVAVSRYDHQWYLCNDSSIEPISEDRLRNIFKGEQQGIFWRPTYQSYLFVFERAKKQAEASKSVGKTVTPALLKKYEHHQLGKTVSPASASRISASSGSLSDID